MKCYPPLSDNPLIFFSHKALLVNHVKHKSWKEARQLSLMDIKPMPSTSLEVSRHFKARARSLPVRGADAAGGEQASNLLTSKTPRPYQVELFCAVLNCTRNSLVYLPTGLGKTLVAGMVLQKLLQLNPERQAYFLVETNALALQQV